MRQGNKNRGLSVRFAAAFLSLLCLFCSGLANSMPVHAAESFSGSSSSVIRPQLYCGRQEHTHGDSCYITATILSCGMEESEGHTHDASCYARRTGLVCTLCETDGHTHTDACYSEQQTLICTLSEDENHSHGAECYQSERILSCTLPEEAAHHHTDSCYGEILSYICGMENDPDHVHTDACLSPDCFVPVCGKTEGRGHVHTEQCYRVEKILQCSLPEHEHSIDCYSSHAPIVETENDWLSSVAPARLNGEWNHDLLEIAKTQLGYAPDGTNCSIGADGAVRYYTRYGDWYSDNPELIYEDWCMMFVSFCIHYAGIDGLPYGCGCQNWLDLVDSALFHPYGDGYNPKPGDIVLFTNGRKAFREENVERVSLGLEPLPESDMYVIADHVGILVSMNKKAFRTIEGNNGPVGYHSYSFGGKKNPGAEELIYGYVSIPKNPHLRTVTDYTGRCSVTGDFPKFAVPYIREPLFSESLRWEQSNDPASFLCAWGVSFVNGLGAYTPEGELEYSFRFDNLPENVRVSFLSDTGSVDIPCTVEGNTVSFSTDLVGTFFFARA